MRTVGPANSTWMVVLCTCLLPGCALGPNALRINRAKYNHAVARTGEEEMLLNLVRLRYGENPEFLEVEGITTQYRFEGRAGIDGRLVEAGAGLLDLTGELQHRERPTITLEPEHDEEFYSRLMDPMNLDTILLLSRNGWATERILRLCVHNINGLDNASLAGGPTPDCAPDFQQFTYLCKLLQQLQRQCCVEMMNTSRLRQVSSEIAADSVQAEDLLAAAEKGYEFRFGESDKKIRLLSKRKQAVLRINPMNADLEGVQTVRSLLQLTSDRLEYDMKLANQSDVPPVVNAGAVDHLPLPNVVSAPQGFASCYGLERDHLAIATRSILELMYFISHAIEVPEEHIERGLAAVTYGPDGERFDWNRVTGDLIRISVSKRRPRTSVVAARYRGHYFYIDDRDERSKATFSLMFQLFNLEIRGGGGENLPILALGLGGDD